MSIKSEHTNTAIATTITTAQALRQPRGGATDNDSVLSAGSRVPRLTGKQRKWLRGRAHHLAAVVRVGQSGTTEAVLREVNQALEAHELVKVRCYRPEAKRRWAEELARATGAVLCGLVGHTAILYRPRREGPSQLARELGRVSGA